MPDGYRKNLVGFLVLAGLAAMVYLFAAMGM